MSSIGKKSEIQYVVKYKSRMKSRRVIIQVKWIEVEIWNLKDLGMF